MAFHPYIPWLAIHLHEPDITVVLLVLKYFIPFLWVSIYRGGGSKYALVRQNKTLVGDFVANLRTVLIFYLTNIL